MNAFVLAHQGLIVLAAVLIALSGFGAWAAIDLQRANRRPGEISPVVPRQPPSPESAEFARYLTGTRHPCP